MGPTKTKSGFGEGSSGQVFSRFRADERAATAVEFALMSVPFLGVLFCILELGVVLLLGTAIESTTRQIARLIKTGQMQQYNIQTASDFRSKLLCPASGAALLPRYLDCNRLTVDVRTSSAIGSSDLTDDIYKSGTSAKFCLGNPQSIVVVRLAYVWPAILPVLALFSNGSYGVNRTGLVNDVPNYPGWNHLIFKAAAFQNEFYQSSATTCS